MRIEAGQWAVITGASSGIGEALARELASRGCRLVLTGRDEERLRVLAGELTAAGRGRGASDQPPVSTKEQQEETSPAGDLDRAATLEDPVWIALDLAEAGAPEQLHQFVTDRGIVPDLLVNNAGLGSGGRFARLPLETERRLLRLNIEALLVLTRLFLPQMVARGRGAILLVSSTAGFFPMPGSTTYAATKAFVTSFGQALWQECRGSGVLVTTVCPGLTRTRFHDRAGLRRRIGRLRFASAVTVARQALDGIEKGKRLVVPGTLNRMAAALSSWVPVRWILAAAAQFTGDSDPR